MRVFVSIDMGVAGITDRRQVRRGTDDYPHARTLMAGEANAVAAAAFEAGAEVVVINDSHGDLNNLQPGDLDGRAQLQIGGGKEPHGMVSDLAAGYDAALLIGAHARAGTAGGVLEHSYSGGTIYDLRVNGAPWGEIELNTAMLGNAGIPVVLVSGDHLACGQAQDLLPDVHTAVVKQGLGYAATRSPSLDASRRVLAEATFASLTGPRPSPFHSRGPVPPRDRLPHDGHDRCGGPGSPHRAHRCPHSRGDGGVGPGARSVPGRDDSPRGDDDLVV